MKRRLTKSEIRDLLKVLKTLVANKRLTKELREKIQRSIDKLELALLRN